MEGAMSEIKRAKLNLEIGNLEDTRRDLEKQAQSANTQYILATIGVIIGVILLIFTQVWWVGLLLLIAGALAVFTQGSKKRGLEKQVKEINLTIRSKRDEMAASLTESEV
jgi:hypothetical protein